MDHIALFALVVLLFFKWLCVRVAVLYACV